MELTKGDIGIVSERDTTNMKVRVKWPSSGVVSGWLQVLAWNGQYNIPEINDQVACLYDKYWEQGIVLGLVLKDGDSPFDDGAIWGLKLGNLEIQISKQTGEATLTSSENITVKGANITIEADALTVKGDMDLTGDLNVTGKMDATGIIKSATDVQSNTVKLNTHMHPTAGTGPPSPPTPGT